MSGNKILLVEDNTNDEVLAIRAIKSRIPNQIVVVHDGVEALEYLFAEGRYEGRDVTDLPAVILLDLKLPKVDGHKVLRVIRADKRTRIVPVVILSSSTEHGDIAESYIEGCNSYISKPVKFEEYSDTIGRISEYWLGFNQPPPNAEGINV